MKINILEKTADLQKEYQDHPMEKEWLPQQILFNPRVAIHMQQDEAGTLLHIIARINSTGSTT